MRYNDRVQFLYETKGLYNTQTSKYDVISKNVGELMACNLNPLSTERVMLEFGDIKRDISVLRLQGTFDKEVTHCLVRGAKYVVLRHVAYTHDTVYYIEQVR